MADIKANVVISMPAQLFTASRALQALANGKVYIGRPDTDPSLPENQIQVYVEQEDGSVISVAQPVMINAGGFPVYNGSIAKFVTVENHAMSVYDSYGVLQFYFPNVLKYAPDQLRQELGSANGGSMIGLSDGLTLQQFADRAGFRLYYVTPEEFGAKGDGVTDDRVPINSAIAVGLPVKLCNFYNVSSGSINILTGTRLYSDGARIKSNSTTAAFLYAFNVDDWSVEGRLTLIGTGTTTDQGQNGFLESGCQNYRVENVTASGISGRGFYQPSNGTWESPRGNKGTWTNCSTYFSYCGREDVASSSSANLVGEFTTWVNFKASGCNIGSRTSAGNCQFIGGMLVDNQEGFTSPEVGTNTTHGQAVGMTIAHNSVYNVNMVAQTAGFTFSGCSIYGDSPTAGVIRLDRCRGVKFVGGNFEASIYNDGPGTNFVIGCYNNNNFAFFRSGQNPEGIVITDLYDQGGYSSRNDIGWAHSEATYTSDVKFSTAISPYDNGRMGFNYSARDPQKTLQISGTRPGMKICPVKGRLNVIVKCRVTDMSSGAAAYLAVRRVRAGVVDTDLCFQTLGQYTSSACAGILNADIDVMAGDGIFIRLVLTGGDGTVSAQYTEFAARYVGGAG